MTAQRNTFSKDKISLYKPELGDLEIGTYKSFFNQYKFGIQNRICNEHNMSRESQNYQKLHV